MGLPDGRESVMRDLLTQALIKYALNCGEEAEPRERAMVLAWGISKGRKIREEVVRADFYLRLGEFPVGDDLLSETGSVSAALDASGKIGDVCKRLKESGVDGFDQFIGLALDLAGLQSMGGVTVAKTQDAGSAAETFWASVGTMNSASRSRGGTASPIEVPENEREYKSKQSSLHGLLVIELDGSEFAGGASKMNATVIPGVTEGMDIVRFNQEVGEMMSGALNEARKFLTIRHGAIPSNESVEISFEERNSLKDGPSAATACTLLLDSLLTGDKLDVSIAVTGDMSADGIVQPVGGIDGKIRGAIASKCSHVAIPRDNVKSISDLCITEGPAYLAKIQIFSIGKFDEARALALAKELRDPKINEAMEIFAEVAEVLNRPGGSSYVANRHVQERLAQVLQLAPNHESARFLRLAGTGNAPKNLSLVGSFIALDRCAKPMINLGKSKNITSSLNEIKDSISDLRALRNTFDPRLKPASDALEDLFAALTEMGDNKLTRGSPRYNGVAGRIDQAIDDLNSAYARLRSDPEVQEELNY